VKYPIKPIAPAFLLLAALCFPQSEAKVQGSQSKSTEDEAIPRPVSNAIFPSVVARVNGENILGRDLEELVRQELSTIGNPEWKNLRGEYRGELTLNKITALINSRLLYQTAVASSIQATDAEIQAEIQKIAKTFKSDEEMDAALAKQNMDRTSLKKSVFENLTTSKYLEETISKKIMVSPEEAADYFSSNPEEFHHPEVVRLSHILIKASGNTPEEDAEARERAEGILARLNKGEDFARLAREYSMDASAAQGGDIGFTSKEGLAQEYSEAAFSLPVAGIKLLRTQYGYHILKVTDKKNEGLFTLEDVKPRLIEHLKNQKYQEELNKLVNQLRGKANIEILISSKELLNP
jgi:peptidyl-prolyl cis-trans isomerase C